MSEDIVKKMHADMIERVEVSFLVGRDDPDPADDGGGGTGILALLPDGTGFELLLDVDIDDDMPFVSVALRAYRAGEQVPTPTAIDLFDYSIFTIAPDQ